MVECESLIIFAGSVSKDMDLYTCIAIQMIYSFVTWKDACPRTNDVTQLFYRNKQLLLQRTTKVLCFTASQYTVVVTACINMDLEYSVNWKEKLAINLLMFSSTIQCIT